jgi:hypothetical protein
VSYDQNKTRRRRATNGQKTTKKIEHFIIYSRKIGANKKRKRKKEKEKG